MWGRVLIPGQVVIVVAHRSCRTVIGRAGTRVLIDISLLVVFNKVTHRTRLGSSGNLWRVGRRRTVSTVGRRTSRVLCGDAANIIIGNQRDSYKPKLKLYHHGNTVLMLKKNALSRHIFHLSVTSY